MFKLAKSRNIFYLHVNVANKEICTDSSSKSKLMYILLILMGIFTVYSIVENILKDCHCDLSGILRKVGIEALTW